ncbi:FmdB family zinc ribbon protein [Actinokineospora xionganensis]|uniref:FmdB family transcriptional regulator n=1 Tax=Actinokineospora xionganensis TaxID=2684470 RepID=A0ABR7LBZ4_9PSEU|nr:FmdB family zinc ribbon protein [Actinokineospora xionganensis]MBC6450239.1 FmdB family transcriptional regulator [Actinokineospora xionganensis]
MPTYQYACTACEHRFDAVQSFTDAALSECPECAGRLRKLYGSVGVVFKGSGFYRTDSRSGSSATAPAATAAATPAKSESSATTSASTSSTSSTSSSTASTTTAKAS